MMNKMCHPPVVVVAVVEVVSRSILLLSLISVVVVLLVGNSNGISAQQPRPFKLFGQTIWDAAEPQQQATAAEQEDPVIQEQKKLYLDSKCFVETAKDINVDLTNKSSPTSKVVTYLLKLKCDLKPIIKQFSVLLRHLDPRPQTQSLEDDRSVAFSIIVPMVKEIDQSKESVKIWSEYSYFYNAVSNYVREALKLIEQREFCTYTTIARFSKLKDWTLGSQLLELAHDLVITDYHSACLRSTIERLPEVPYVVKDVVKMYIDGIEDTRKPDLNDPAYLEIDAGFDIDAAIAREGPIDQVASLMLTIPSKSQGSLKELFMSECHDLLMKLEEQWQPMEMMNQMLATESNAILQLNNLIMHSIIPQKYAQICSQLIVKA